MSKYESGDPRLNRYLKEDLKVLLAVAEGLSLKYPFGSEHWQALNRIYLDCENKLGLITTEAVVKMDNWKADAAAIMYEALNNISEGEQPPQIIAEAALAKAHGLRWEETK